MYGESMRGELQSNEVKVKGGERGRTKTLLGNAAVLPRFEIARVSIIRLSDRFVKIDQVITRKRSDDQATRIICYVISSDRRS